MFASLQGEINLDAELVRYGFIPKAKKAKKPSAKAWNILEALCAFDIETTTMIMAPETAGAVNAHAFMYVWQFQLGDKTIVGRTWEEFREFIEQLTHAVYHAQEYYHLAETPILVCWVHNLSYEWQWLSGLYNFENEDVFFRDIRKPIYCRLNNVIEFRCSYIQTNMSLKELTKQLGVEEKLSGDEFDYSKIRFPWTPLTDYELEYCIRDVRSLVECMRVKMQNDGDNLQTIPLTSTGYVRRDCVKAIKDRYLQIKDMLPDVRQYRLLRQAFRGGNTHASMVYSGKILSNVYSYDMSSCYPAQQLTKSFPMTRFRWISDRLSMDRILKFINIGYAVVGYYQFKGIRLKNKKEPIPYLNLARLACVDFKLDNGRILEADYLEVALTEIDLQIVLRQYDFDEISVTQAMVAQKAPLPEEYREVIRQYFDRKTKLKPPKGVEAPYQYHKSKEKLNGIYGMSAQDPIHQEILYNHGDYTISDYSSEEAEKNLSRAKFPYQWGVYTTAYARRALQEAIDIAGGKMVYCDTDSVKTIGPIPLDDMNRLRMKMAISNNAFSADRRGENHYMGVFELEGVYDRFVTCGAKRYAYEQDDKIHVTVSGVCKHTNPETGIPYAVEELGCLENFKEGFIWHQAAGTTSIYNDDDDFDYTDPESGRTVHIIKNVAIIPRTYEMSFAKDYRRLLKEIDLYGEYKSKRE